MLCQCAAMQLTHGGWHRVQFGRINCIGGWKEGIGISYSHTALHKLTQPLLLSLQGCSMSPPAEAGWKWKQTQQDTDNQMRKAATCLRSISGPQQCSMASIALEHAQLWMIRLHANVCIIMPCQSIQVFLCVRSAKWSEDQKLVICHHPIPSQNTNTKLAPTSLSHGGTCLSKSTKSSKVAQTISGCAWQVRHHWEITPVVLNVASSLIPWNCGQPPDGVQAVQRLPASGA